MSVRYDFMDEVSCLLWSLIYSLNRPQSSHTEILIALIIMPNTIHKECAHFTGCVIPFLTCIQCRGTTVPVPFNILSLIGITISSFFEILNQRQWMDGFGQSSELDQQLNQRYTCPKSIHSPTSMHESTTSKARYSRCNTTSHRPGTCTRYCVGSSSASLVSGYESLLGLILGSEYGYISTVKRDGWHTREPTLLDEISIARASQVSMSVSIYQEFPCSLSGVILLKKV